MRNEVNRALVAKKNINLKTNMTMRRINLNLFRYVAMLLCVLTLGVGQAWAGGGGSSNYYASLKITQSGPTGAGSVYVANSNSKPGTANPNTAVKSAATTSSGGNVTMYWWVDINPGYNVSLSGKVSGGPYSAASANGSVSCAASTSADGTQAYTATATFVAVTVNSVDAASKDLAPTNPSIDYPFTVTFATSNLKTIALDLNKSPETADGKFTITSWAQNGNNVVATGKFNGGDSYGGASRNNSTTVSLQSKASGSTAKTCTVTANFPALAFVSVEADDVFATQGESGKTGSATFKYNYAAEDDFPTTPTLTPTSGTGAFTVTGYTVTPDFSKGETTVTVNYSFDTNNGIGETPATLTLTAANGDVRTVTVTGHSEAAATNDVSVTTAAGVTTEYATWAAGLTAANASAGSTLKLLRDIDLTGTYGITGTQGITQTMTLDLNGKILSGAINGSILNPKTAGKTLTIKDSKTGGRIQNITPDYNGVTYGVNISAGSVILESGTIHAENNAVFNHSTLTSLGTRAVKLAANSTFEMKGGMLEAVGGREVYGIYQESSSANNTADKSVVTIKGGTIRAEAPAYVYGIRSYGKVNMSDGTIDVIVNTGTVNSNATYVASNFNDNTLHRYGYGIRMYGSASATTASNYSGTLTITGGTINVTNQNKTMNGTTMYNEHIYGVYMDVSVTGAGAGKTAPDGTKVQKACAVGSIENATINLNHAGVLGYGVLATGCYNSYNNTYTPLQIKNSTINVTTFQTAYGVYANAYINWNSTLTKLTGNGGCTYGDVELTNVTINATTTGGTGAYCAWATCTSGTVAKAKAETGSTSEGNATYYGEYAVAGKITVNSGTFTADAKTSSAYGIGSSDRAKCVRNVNGVFANRDAVADPQGALSDNTPTSEAYPELNIHGGDFSATTGTTTAIAVKSGGNTLIDGGTFNAYAGGSTAYGLYVTAGKTTANGVTFPASATTVAYGVYVYGGISDWSLFPYAGEVELNNCNATATARTTTDARAVYVNGTTKVYTQASFDAMKSANNSNYTTYGDYAQVGERAFVGKATINGGTYSATAETTTAFGIYMMSTRVSTNKEAIAYNPLVVKNATIAAKTNTSTSAYGVSIGGGGLIENCTITATAGTTTASGVRAIDKTTVIKNSTISAKGTDAVYGLEGYVDASTAHGYCWHGDFDLSEAGTTKVTAESTGATKAYTIYLNAKAVNVASGAFAGDYATAANATINGGTYIAKTNGGTSGYTLALTGTQTKGTASAQPEVLVEDGKFNGATAEIGTAGVAGHVQLKGGYYVHNTNLSKYIPEGYEEFPLPDDRPEYTEGYRYAIEPVGNHGNYVCQIGSTKYKTLEEALQAANSGNTILMIANYTLSAGDWILKSGVKLLVPYSGQTSTKETNLEVVEGTATPSQNLKLSFAEGAHLVCNGVIEAGAKQTGQGSSELTGQVYGSYGHIYMAEGSSITIESGATLYAWGYVTGKGEITIKNGGKSYEMFQFGWYKGGNTTSSIYSNRSSYKIFPMTDYSYQNIECPIMYYPGASAYGRSAVKPSSYSSMEKPLAMLVGTADNCMFKMTTAEASANTWVKKVYDPETDITNWIMNSGAAISGISMSVGVSVNSADFYLPITSNFRITLNYGDMNINNDVIFLPGSQLIINKEATGILKSGKLLFFYDAEDWFTGLGHVSVTASGWSKAKTCGYYYYPATYSPTWNTANPRKNVYARDKASIDKGVTPLPDAELFVHGKMIVNGSLYTSGDGNASSIGRNANIHSTNEDAGKIQFNTKVTGSKALYKVCFAVGSSEANNSWSDMIYGGQTTAYPAHLTNGDGTYVQSSGTEAGKQYVYVDNQWQCWEEIGCYTYDAQNHPYAKPAAYVQLTTDQPDANHLLHDAATGTRNFVWDENCYWWEVVTTPTVEGYYQSINPDYNGKYNYYYYDGSANCWKIKKITVTWNIEGSTTNYSVGYGTKPEWYGGTPSKTSSSSNYYYIWDGWIVPGSETPLANSELPEVTEDITFTAHFYEKYYEYNITFKNDDGTVLDSRNWNKGTTPSYEGTPTKNPTAAETYEFNGTWTPAIAVVSGSATYVANYTSHPRAYTITFLNYDMSKLGTAEVVYNNTPSNATYLAAVDPKTEDPYKPDNSAFSFEFAGWRLQGASSNGFAQVKGDQSYIAQFNQTTKKYKISFVDEDGETVLHWTQLEYGQTPSYTWADPADKQDVEWSYVFTGWDPAEFTTVEGPQTYTAVYNKTKREYTITWLNDDNSLIEETQVEYGVVPTHADATKATTAEYTYTFAGWTPERIAVTGDATYKATFTSTKNSYTITWLNEDNTLIDQTTVEYGVVPTHADATKATTAEYTYTFAGWDNTPVAVTGNATYKATFNQSEKKYSVSVVAGANGSVSPALVSGIGCETASGDITATPNAGYNFVNWTLPEGVTAATGYAANSNPIRIHATATGNTITANFVAGTVNYTVKHMQQNIADDNYTEFESETKQGTTATATAAEARSYTGFTSQAFEQSMIAGDGSTEVKIYYNRNPYTITWRDALVAGNIKTEQLKYGSIPAFAYKKPATAQYTYTLIGWTDGTTDYDFPATLPVVTGDATYTARYNSVTRSYAITFLNDNNSELQSSPVQYGQTPSYGESTPVSTKTDGIYQFKGWSPAIAQVTGEATYTAQYEKLMNLVVEEGETLPVTITAEVTTTTVHAAGQVNVAADKILTTDDLILEATPSSSGEITGSGTVNVTTNAYFHFSQAGGAKFKAKTWYAVAVPWQVNVPANVLGDVYTKVGEGEFVQQTLGKTFDLIYYDGERRATGATKAWNYVEDDPAADQVMYPGRAYMIYLASDADVIRFKKNNEKLLYTNVDVAQYSSTIDGSLANWNGIANPAIYQAYLNVGATEGWGQVYNPESKGYDPFKMSETKLQVGQPIFVQSAVAGTIVANASTYSSSLAPRRANGSAETLTRFEVLFAASETDASDRIIVRMNEDKEEDKYIVGQDLAKMGVSSVVPQMWIDRYDSKMCINTAIPVNNKAVYPLSLFVPQAGEYMISIQDADVNGQSADMLYLTYDNRIIWNLTYSPYTASLEKGTNTHYGLRIVHAETPAATTDMEGAVVDAHGETRKVLIEDKVFIIRGNQVYSVDGQLVK